MCVETDKNKKYIGTTKGLVIVEKNKWKTYNKSNSNLPSNKIRKIKIKKDIVWIATSSGLVRYSKGNFEVVFSMKKNQILDDDFTTMTIDENDCVWLGTNRGLYSYKESAWRVFNTNNSQLPNNHIRGVIVDKENKKWIATKKGIVTIIDNEWSIFNKKNTPLKTNEIRSIVSDDYDRVWVGTEKGFVSYDGKRWEKHKINKKEPFVINLFIDAFDNKWLCTHKKIIIYNTEGVEFKNNISDTENIIVSR